MTRLVKECDKTILDAPVSPSGLFGIRRKKELRLVANWTAFGAPPLEVANVTPGPVGRVPIASFNAAWSSLGREPGLHA